MAEFNWAIDDIKRAQRDFSNNFMRLDCIRTESYDVAIDCMTECIEKKAIDVQPVVYAHKTINVGRRSYCSNCGKLAIMEVFCSKCGAKVMDGDAE